MFKVALEQKITFGGLLTIATVLVTIGITWGIVTTQAEQTSREVAGVKSDVEDLKGFRYDDNTRMVRVETLLNEILNEVRAN
jgi:hypothetical protein